MSSIGSKDFSNPNDPNDPLHYAPRSVRSRPRQQPRPVVQQTRPVRPTSSRSGFDDMLEDAFAKSRRHPLDPEFVYQPAQPRARFSVISRFIAAIGVVAIIGVIFFMVIPKSQGSDPTSTGTPKESEDSQALLQKFVQFGKTQDTPPAGAGQTAPDDSKALLQKFMQWQQKQQ
jgi:hypothetical protein